MDSILPTMFAIHRMGGILDLDSQRHGTRTLGLKPDTFLAINDAFAIHPS